VNPGLSRKAPHFGGGLRWLGRERGTCRLRTGALTFSLTGIGAVPLLNLKVPTVCDNLKAQ